MLGQVLVELARDGVELGEPGPGHGGEVVVLVVEADVVGEEVQGPVVREGLGHGDLVRRLPLRRRHRLVHVVLGDEVARRRVQAPRQEGRQEQVEQGLLAQERDEHVVEAELHGDVGRRHPRERHRVDAHGAQGVEEDLEGAEEGLAQDGVQDHGLERRRQVRVQPVHAQRLVVRQVVGPEAGAVGHADRQVRDDGEQPVRRRRPERQVVADLVDRQEQVLVRRRPHHVRERPEPGREERRVAQGVGARDLDADYEEDDVFREGFGAAELGYLFVVDSVLVSDMDNPVGRSGWFGL